MTRKLKTREHATIIAPWSKFTRKMFKIEEMKPFFYKDLLGLSKEKRPKSDNFLKVFLKHFLLSLCDELWPLCSVLLRLSSCNAGQSCFDL